MLMAIIEFELNEGAEVEFRDLIDKLQPKLNAIDGFIGAYPSASLTHEGRMYEISYWRDAAALARWTADPDHGHAMKRGRESLLKWYRIRVGEIDRDWTVGPVPADLAL
jgi:heme-degrading monooxygenase HmoA